MDSKHFVIFAVICSLFSGQCFAAPEPGLLGLGGGEGEGGGGLLGHIPIVGNVLDHVPLVGNLLEGGNDLGDLGGAVEGIVENLPIIGGILGGGDGAGVLGGVEDLLGNVPIVGELLGRDGIVGGVGNVLNKVEQLPDELLQPLLKGLGQPILELGGKSIMGVLLSGVIGDTVNAAGVPLAEATQLIKDALSGNIPGLGKDVEDLIPHLLAITEQLPNILGDIAKIPHGMKTAGNLMETLKGLSNQAAEQGSGEQLNQLFSKLGIPASEIERVQSQLNGATGQEQSYQDGGNVQYEYEEQPYQDEGNLRYAYADSGYPYNGDYEAQNYEAQNYEAQNYEEYPAYQAVQEY